MNQVLQHGLRLDRIHRAIEFDQSPWLKSYIDFNTQLRTAATSDFEKDSFGLMNNSVFGKTMENIRKHRNIKLVTTEEKYLRTVMKPKFKSGVLFGENLMGCEMGKIKVVMNKPVYLGQVILDLSKIIMYEFHYDYMVPKYGLQNYNSVTWTQILWSTKSKLRIFMQTSWTMFQLGSIPQDTAPIDLFQ